MNTVRKSGYWVFVICLFLSTEGNSPAAKKSKPKTIPVALLPMGADQGNEELAEQVQAIVLEELQQMDFLNVVPEQLVKRQIQFLTKKKAYNETCPQNRRCLRSLGIRLKVRAVFQVSLTSSQQGTVINVSSFDAKLGKKITTEEEAFQIASEEVDQKTRWLSRKAASPLLKSMAKGRKGKWLLINCNEAGFELVINGKSFKIKKDRVSPKAEAGTYDITVKKEGYKTFRDVVMVKPDQPVALQIQLEKEGKKKQLASGIEKEQEAIPLPITAPEEASPEGAKTEAPAWALFGKKTAPKAGAEEKGIVDQKSTLQKEKPKHTEKPFLPERTPVADDTMGRKEDKVYQTWWFWTLVGVGAATLLGGGGYLTYYALQGGGDGQGGGVGSATFSWE